jgi:thiol-disulfide isomerase/thioredoxin
MLRKKLYAAGGVHRRMAAFSSKAVLTNLFWSAALCATAAGAQTPAEAPPKIGDRPPLLKTTTLLQAPPGARFDVGSLKGKVVVLEFWATWCGACVLAIPHLNELADKFRDRPIQFVAITSEDEATVRSFLAKKPINAWVALDADKAMKTAYAVDAIPHTVILAKDGTIASITYPTSVTGQTLEDLLAGKSMPVNTNILRRVGGAASEKDGKAVAAPLFEVSVRPSAPNGTTGSSSGGGSLRYNGYTVLKLLPEALEGATAARVWTNAPRPEGTYDVAIKQPRGHTMREAHDLLWQAMQSAFALTATKTTNEMAVFVLRAGQTNGPGLTPASTKGGATAPARER